MDSRKLFACVIGTILFILTLSSISVVPVIAETFTVINTQDQGDGSLTWAMGQADANSGPDTVAFALSKEDPHFKSNNGSWEINVTSSLPTLYNGGTFIDGSSQSVFSGEDTNSNGLEILILGNESVIDAPGLTIVSADNKLKGLCIGGFNGETITISGEGAHHNTIENCYIGIDENGIFGFNVNNSIGITLKNGAHHNTIGSSSADKRNILSGFFYQAIIIDASNENIIIGNYIGVDKTGIEPLGNGWVNFERHDYEALKPGQCKSGILLFSCSSTNQIGGSNSGEGNIISASGRAGIRIEGTGTNNNTIQGNFIGLGADGETVLPNGESGIWISIGPAYNIIGGEEEGAGNVISGNKSSGIQMRYTNQYNSIIGNLIGTNATATGLRPNAHNGIYFFGSAANGYPQNNIIGPANIIIANGNERAEENLNSTWAAIRMDSSGTSNNSILGNYLGTNPQGTLASEYNSGVIIGSGSHHNTIGPDNIIAKNKKYGVWVRDENSLSNHITQNLIYHNESGAIYLQNGGNAMLEKPIILTAEETGFSGTTIPSGTVEVFNGNNQANVYLRTVIADENGDFSWSGSMNAPFISATVTDADGNTSMLSESMSLPVELSSFSAIKSGDDNVLLTWQTESETNNLGFYVQRKSEGQEFENISFLSGSGTTVQSQKYEFIDQNVAQTTVYYRLRQIDFDGSESFSHELKVQLTVPENFSLSKPYPNPFNSETVFSYSLPEAGDIKISIVNIKGQTVRLLKENHISAGEHRQAWDGLDNQGLALPSGQYFIQFESSGQIQTQKIIMIK